MEEPGDEELVLVRCALAVIGLVASAHPLTYNSRQSEPMPTVIEGNQSRSSMNSYDMDDEHHHGTPLLERDSHGMLHIEAPFHSGSTGMAQTLETSAVSLQPQLTEHDIIDDPSNVRSAEQPVPGVGTPPPPHEVPSYIQAIGSDSSEVSHHPLGQQTTQPSSDTGRPSSLFRSLLSRGTGSAVVALPSTESSVASSSNASPSMNPDSNTRGHRKSPSSSSSRASFALSRILSISTHPQEPETEPIGTRRNISAPLKHTLKRTEFTYPRSGPTPDQLKFISSRESLGRFGVPFGQDAIDASVAPPSFSAILGHERRPSFGSARSETSNDTPEAGPTNAALELPLPQPAMLSPPSSQYLSDHQSLHSSPTADAVTLSLLPVIMTSRPTPPGSPPPHSASKSPSVPEASNDVASVQAASPLPPSPVEVR